MFTVLSSGVVLNNKPPRLASSVELLGVLMLIVSMLVVELSIKLKSDLF